MQSSAGRNLPIRQIALKVMMVAVAGCGCGAAWMGCEADAVRCGCGAVRCAVRCDAVRFAGVVRGVVAWCGVVRVIRYYCYMKIRTICRVIIIRPEKYPVLAPRQCRRIVVRA